MKLTHFAPCLFLLPALASAADEAIATDRPDFVESSDVVGAGRVQFESGVSFERDSRNGDVARVTTTPLLVRVGLGSRWEARLETDGLARLHDTTGGVERSERGYSDISLGAKWHLRDGEGAKPGVAMLAHVDLDTGSSAFRGAGARPSLRGVAEWELPADMSLGVMPGVVYDSDGSERYWTGIMAATFGKQWTSRFRTFVEVSGQQLAHAANGGNVVTYDGGAVFLVTPKVQLDAALSLGANDNTPGTAYGIGLSLKL